MPALEMEPWWMRKDAPWRRPLESHARPIADPEPGSVMVRTACGAFRDNPAMPAAAPTRFLASQAGLAVPGQKAPGRAPDPSASSVRAPQPSTSAVVWSLSKKHRARRAGTTSPGCVWTQSWSACARRSSRAMHVGGRPLWQDDPGPRAEPVEGGSGAAMTPSRCAAPSPTKTRWTRAGGAELIRSSRLATRAGPAARARGRARTTP